MENNEAGQQPTPAPEDTHDRPPVAEEPNTPIGSGLGDQPVEKTTSERKRVANQQNAQHSTGPKTDRGKQAVRYNAIKYGLYTRDVVISTGEAQEDQQEFDALVEELVRYWDPQNFMEFRLVNTIAESEWRLRRATRAEVGEIRRATDAVNRQQLSDIVNGLGLASCPDNGFQQVTRSTELIKIQVARLAQVRESVEQCGYVNDPLQKGLERAFGKESEIATLCYRTSQAVQSWLVEDAHGRRVDDSVDRVEECKRSLLRAIDAQAEGLKRLTPLVETVEVEEHEATRLANNLPSKEFIDKLTKYETALEKKKERAISLLLRLRAARAGS